MAAGALIHRGATGLVALTFGLGACAPSHAAPGASARAAGPTALVPDAGVAEMPDAMDTGAPASGAAAVGITREGLDGSSPASTSDANAPDVTPGSLAAGPSAATLMAMSLGLERPGTSKDVLFLDVDVIRATPSADALTNIVRKWPAWDILAAPELGVDWVLVSTPSFAHSDRGEFVLRCAADDSVIDEWLDRVATKTHGAPLPLAALSHIHGVKATIDRAPRAVMRVQPHVVAIVPLQVAGAAAGALSKAHFPERVSSGEASRLTTAHAHRLVPDLAPAEVTELRWWIEPAPAGGAESVLEEDAPTPARAAQVKQQIEAALQAQNSPLARAMTAGVLDHVDVTIAGSTVRAHLRATRAQVDAVLAVAMMAASTQP